MLRALVMLLLLAASAVQAAGIEQTRIKELRVLLDEDCGACHGLTRRGGLGSPLIPEALADQPAEALAATILDGRPGTPMPPWRGLLTEGEADWIARALKGEANRVR